MRSRNEPKGQGAPENNRIGSGCMVRIDDKMMYAIGQIALVEGIPFDVALAVLASWGVGYWEGGGIPRDIWDAARARRVDVARGRDAKG